MPSKIIYCFFGFLFITSLRINAQDTLVHSGAIWQYLDDGSDPGVGWTERHFPAKNWKEGGSPLGYNYEGLATTIEFGDTNGGGKHITSYFRYFLELEENTSYFAYKIDFKRDDGAVIYVNNIEFLRSNMPDGPIGNKTLSAKSITREMEGEILTAYLEPKSFRSGINTIAISVHQRSTSSTDLILDFQLIGIKNMEMLHQFLANEKTEIENDQLLLLDIKHELNEEKIKTASSNKINNLFLGVIAFGMVLFFTLIYFFYKYYLRQLKDRESIKAERSNFEERIKFKSQEIINYSVANIQNRNFFKGLKLDLLKLGAGHPTTKHEISKLVNKIETQTMNDEAWEQMKQHFNIVYSGFFEKLAKECPSLSEQELKHCGFIKLRLDTKQISHIFRIDSKSVQSSRYRIKKKLNLPENEDLRHFINHL